MKVGAVLVPPAGLNFINILHTPFSYQSKFCSLFLITFGFEIYFLVPKFWQKGTHKVLMKLDPSIYYLSKLAPKERGD